VLSLKCEVNRRSHPNLPSSKSKCASELVLPAAALAGNAQVCAPCMAAKGDTADLDGGITWDPNAIYDSAGEVWLSRLRKRSAAQLVAEGAEAARSPWRPNEICESDVARKRQDTVVRRSTPRTLARGALGCRGEQGVDKRSLAARR